MPQAMQPSLHIIAAGGIESSTDQRVLESSLATAQSHDALSDSDQEGRTDVRPLHTPEEPHLPLQFSPLPAQVLGEGHYLPEPLSLLRSLAAVCCSVIA